MHWKWNFEICNNSSTKGNKNHFNAFHCCYQSHRISIALHKNRNLYGEEEKGQFYKNNDNFNSDKNNLNKVFYRKSFSHRTQSYQTDDPLLIGNSQSFTLFWLWMWLFLCPFQNTDVNIVLVKKKIVRYVHTNSIIWNNLISYISSVYC